MLNIFPNKKYNSAFAAKHKESLVIYKFVVIAENYTTRILSHCELKNFPNFDIQSRQIHCSWNIDLF